VSDSIWKKEISFSRKKPEQDAAADAPAAPVESAPAQPKQSVWKKEISFGRKKPEQDATVDASAAPVESASAQPKRSVWKKEISLGRKAKEVAPEQVEASAAPEPEQSVWKKEISFSRKKRDKELERIAQDAAQVVAPSFAPVPPPSDLPPTALAEAAVAAMPEVDVDEPPALPEAAEPAPLVALPFVELPPTDEPLSPVPAPLQIAPEPWEPAPEPAEPVPLQIAPEPWELAPEPAEPVPLQIAPEPSELAPEPAEPAPVEAVMPSFESAEPLLEPAEPPFESAEPPLEAVMPSTPFAPVSFEQAPGVPMVPSEPAPVASAPVTPVPELPLDAVAAAEPEQPLAPRPPPLSTLSAAVLAASTDPPEVAPPPEADVVVFPEAPTAPVLPAQPESVALTPVPPPIQITPLAPPIQLTPEPAELPPLAAAEQPVDPWLAAAALPPAPASPLPTAVHPPVPAAELPSIAEPKVPFWKKEVSFSRKPKANLEPQPPAVAPPADALAASGPWWKKELSFSRKPKPAAAVATAAVAAVAPAAKTPWWKKEIGAKKGGAAVTAAADALTEVAAGPRAPFWKRRVSVAKPKLPKGSAKAGSRKGSKGAKRLVGLKIGASQLAAARVSNNGVAELEQVARQPLPMGIVVGGELRDPDALTEALKVFFAKNKLPKKGVRLGIANNRIGVRIFDIVGVDEEKQLANAIHFRAQEALPIPLDEAVLDYHVLDESVDAEGRNVKRVLLVVAHKELIDRYVGACRKAGITLAGIDLEAFALLRSLSPPTDGGSAALVAVAIGYDRSTFAVSDGRVCEFTRVLEWGGWTLNVALARAFDTAPSEVEALKCALSLDGSVAPDDLSPEQTAAAVDTVRRQVQSFARELVSSLQFYQNQPGSLGIGEIVITGGTAQLPGLAEELERLIGVRVRVGNPLARLKVSKRVGASAGQIGSLAVAIGLGIED
jgi:type IV pilus assembly protein PilM